MRLSQTVLIEPSHLLPGFYSWPHHLLAVCPLIFLYPIYEPLLCLLKGKSYGPFYSYYECCILKILRATPYIWQIESAINVGAIVVIIPSLSLNIVLT